MGVTDSPERRLRGRRPLRELPWIAANDAATLQPGTVLAYDYGADLDGYMLHVEDRVLVDTDGPHRLSDGWDLSDAREGFRRLL